MSLKFEMFQGVPFNEPFIVRVRGMLVHSFKDAQRLHLYVEPPLRPDDIGSA